LINTSNEEWRWQCRSGFQLQKFLFSNDKFQKEGLSSCEYEVLELVARGCKNREIALALEYDWQIIQS
jgi:DNA-binding NarL/FixJ family response regulator